VTKLDGLGFSPERLAGLDAQQAVTVLVGSLLAGRLILDWEEAGEEIVKANDDPAFDTSGNVTLAFADAGIWLDAKIEETYRLLGEEPPVVKQPTFEEQMEASLEEWKRRQAPPSPVG
jgi:hypothetical protein